MAIAARTVTDEGIQKAVNELTWDAEVEARAAQRVSGEPTDLDVAAAAAPARFWVERQAAERVACSAPGVPQVENRVTVRP